MGKEGEEREGGKEEEEEEGHWIHFSLEVEYFQGVRGRIFLFIFRLGRATNFLSSFCARFS